MAHLSLGLTGRQSRSRPASPIKYTWTRWLMDLIAKPPNDSMQRAALGAAAAAERWTNVRAIVR